MSYILDALKKSDEDRQNNQSPTIQTMQRPAKSSQNNFNVLLIVVIVFCAMVIAGLLVYLLLDKDIETVSGVRDQQTVSGSYNAAVPADKVQVESVNQESQGEENKALPSDSVSTTPDETSPTVAFADLPDNVRTEIPPLTFSFHVYSQTVPTNRSIIINKRLSKEGDVIEKFLKLEEITPEGVVLRWKDKKFFINVVENW